MRDGRRPARRRLRTVRPVGRDQAGYFEHDWIDEVFLDFESGTLRVGVDVDRDTVELAAVAGADREARSPQLVDAFGAPSGSQLLWAWDMTNQRGYRDAVQFHFQSEPDGDHTIVQIVAVASELLLYRLERVAGPGLTGTEPSERSQ